MENSEKPKNNLYPYLIVGASIILGAIIFSFAWVKHINSKHTIVVTGEASIELMADFAILRGTIVSESNEAVKANAELQRQQQVLRKYLLDKGFEFESITESPVRTSLKEGSQVYLFEQDIAVSSKNVYLIRDVALQINSLVEDDLNFKVKKPEYFLLDLNGIETEMQTEAFRDARNKAEKIVREANRKLGPLTSSDAATGSLYGRTLAQEEEFLHSITKEVKTVVIATFLLQ